MLQTPSTDIRRAGDRFATRTWLDSRHSFSFGSHWDPTNTHFGLLLVSNDDVVQPGTALRRIPETWKSSRGSSAAVWFTRIPRAIPASSIPASPSG